VDRRGIVGKELHRHIGTVGPPQVNPQGDVFMPETTVTVTRQDNGANGEYHARIEGIDAVGRLIWTARDHIRTAASTQVPPEMGGRGVAARLVEALIADARTQGFKVVPACSYVDAAFKRHPEWADLLA